MLCAHAFLTQLTDGWKFWIVMFAVAALFIWMLLPGKKVSQNSRRQVRDQCPSGGRHRPRLAQEHLGRGQIAYRTRCSKCNCEIGFGFDDLGRR